MLMIGPSALFEDADERKTTNSNDTRILYLVSKDTQYQKLWDIFQHMLGHINIPLGIFISEFYEYGAICNHILFSPLNFKRAAIFRHHMLITCPY